MTPEEVRQLKRRAKEIHKAAPDVSHTHILEDLAKKAGFANWHALIMTAGGSEAVRAINVEKNTARRERQAIRKASFTGKTEKGE